MQSPDTAVRWREVDPEVLQDLRRIEAAGRTLAACGEKAEPWELFTLFKSCREEFLCEIERLDGRLKAGGAAKFCPELQEHLARIRAELGPLAGLLFQFIHVCPDVVFDPEHLDLAFVFLMGSARARESVGRWVADPAGSGAEAALKLKILSKLAEACRRAMAEEPAPAASPAKSPETSVHRPKAASSRLKPGLVENLRRIDLCRDALRGIEATIGWDVYYFAITQGEEASVAIEELQELKSHGKPGEYAGALHRFRSRLKETRAPHEGMIPPLRSYLTGVFGSFDSERDTLALAILAGSPEGRHLGRQWLDDPALCHDVAIASMTILRARAGAYLDAARNPKEPQRVA